MKPAAQTEYIVQAIREGASMYEEDARAFLAEHDAHIRTQAAADIHRAELPNFPSSEAPELVAKAVRAVDVRLAQWGDQAPYASGDPLEPLTDNDASQTFAEAVMATTDGTPFSYTDHQGRTVLLVPFPLGPA